MNPEKSQDRPVCKLKRNSIEYQAGRKTQSQAISNALFLPDLAQLPPNRHKKSEKNRQSYESGVVHHADRGVSDPGFIVGPLGNISTPVKREVEARCAISEEKMPGNLRKCFLKNQES